MQDTKYIQFADELWQRFAETQAEYLQTSAQRAGRND